MAVKGIQSISRGIIDKNGVYTGGRSQFHHRAEGMEKTPVAMGYHSKASTALETIPDPNPNREFDSFLFGRHEEITVFILNEEKIGALETSVDEPVVNPNGTGTTQVLKILLCQQKEIFSSLEEEFRSYLPEVERLIVDQTDQGDSVVQVKEAGIENPVAISELSAGSRKILALLVILYQPNRPDLILFEDIERDIHPRSLKPLVEAMRRISKEHGVQIIMTTHSPYVLDCFQEKEFWGDVVIVEKTDAVSRLTNADERLIALGYEKEMENVPLGDLWYSGALGGVAGHNELWDEPLPESPKP